MGMRDLLLARFSVPFWDMQCTLAINLYTLSHPHPSPFTLLTASHPHATLSLHHSLNASSPHCITPHCIILLTASLLTPSHPHCITPSLHHSFINNITSLPSVNEICLRLYLYERPSQKCNWSHLLYSGCCEFLCCGYHLSAEVFSCQQVSLAGGKCMSCVCCCVYAGLQ